VSERDTAHEEGEAQVKAAQLGRSRKLPYLCRSTCHPAAPKIHTTLTSLNCTRYRQRGQEDRREHEDGETRALSVPSLRSCQRRSGCSVLCTKRYTHHHDSYGHFGSSISLRQYFLRGALEIALHSEGRLKGRTGSTAINRDSQNWPFTGRETGE